MKTLNIHDKDPNEISSLVEQFIDTGERPIQIITDNEFYSKRKKVVGEILNRERKQGKLKFYCFPEARKFQFFQKTCCAKCCKCRKRN